MNRIAGKRPRQHGERGQILVVAVLSLIAMIGGVSLVLEGGNAYAHQRVAQNAADAVANAGATILARVLGMNAFRASADATSVTGALIGGLFLPVVFPVNIVDCAGDGSIAGVGEENWEISEPGDPPVGQEYIVPLCKTDAGSFMILDLDGTMNNCDEEVSDP